MFLFRNRNGNGAESFAIGGVARAPGEQEGVDDGEAASAGEGGGGAGGQGGGQAHSAGRRNSNIGTTMYCLRPPMLCPLSSSLQYIGVKHLYTDWLF